MKGFQIAALFIAVLTPIPAWADLAQPGSTDAIGISASAPTDHDLDRIASVGFSVVRMDMSWGAVEKAKGRYDFKVYLDLAQKMKRRGLRPMFILAYGNPLYSAEVPTIRRGVFKLRPAAPATPNEVTAYALWTAAAVKAFRSFDPIWEIWNEPDVDHFWPPRSDAIKYSSMAEAACSAMKRVDPNATIVGPALGRAPARGQPDSKFLMAFLRSQAAHCVDGISVHPYANDRAYSDLDYTWQKMSEILNRDGRGLTAVPVNSEVGTPSFKDTTELDQARSLFDVLLVGMRHGLRLNVLYVWKDDKASPGTILGHFGLVRADGSEKPALMAIRAFFGNLRFSKFECEAKLSSGAEASVFRNYYYKTNVLVIRGTEGSSVTWKPTEGILTGVGETFLGEPIRDLARNVVNITADPMYINITDGAAADMCKG